MLYYPMVLFVIAVLAAILGFDGLVVGCAGIALLIAGLASIARRVGGGA